MEINNDFLYRVILERIREFEINYNIDRRKAEQLLGEVLYSHQISGPIDELATTELKRLPL